MKEKNNLKIAKAATKFQEDWVKKNMHIMDVKDINIDNDLAFFNLKSNTHYNEFDLDNIDDIDRLSELYDIMLYNLNLNNMPSDDLAYCSRYKRLMHKLSKHSYKFIAAACLIGIWGINTFISLQANSHKNILDFTVNTDVSADFSDVLEPETAVTTKISEYYEPSYIPAGYDLDRIFTSNSNNNYSICYKNSKNQIISFTQQVINSSDSGIDTVNSELQDIYIHNNKGFILYNKNHYSLHWSDDNYKFNLIGNNKEELIKIAESLAIQH